MATIKVISMKFGKDFHVPHGLSAVSQSYGYRLFGYILPWTSSSLNYVSKKYHQGFGDTLYDLLRPTVVCQIFDFVVAQFGF